MIGVTGGSGFVGSSLLQLLGHKTVRCFGRQRPIGVDQSLFVQGELDQLTDYQQFLQGLSCVIHCAARVHVMEDDCINPLAAYRQVNTDATVKLARQAAAAGVKRFIYISTIKVNGEQTLNGQQFTSSVSEVPRDPYATSKYEAEQQLRKLAESSDMDCVIIRPPLVYGPGVKANFASILKLASKGIPLPFACINANRRSLVSIDNLVNLIVTCIDHPCAANETFLVSDNQDLSTAELFGKLRAAFGKPSRLLPVPDFFFKLAFILVGKPEFYQRLCGSLQLDISETIEKLQWIPPFTVEESFSKTALYFFKKDN